MLVEPVILCALRLISLASARLADCIDRLDRDSFPSKEKELHVRACVVRYNILTVNDFNLGHQLSPGSESPAHHLVRHESCFYAIPYLQERRKSKANGEARLH